MQMRLRLQIKDPSSVRQSVAYQALQKIAEFYNADTELKGLSSRERLQKRQEVIKPMVEEFFAWVKQHVSDCTVPPKSKTGQGLNFVINQEKILTDISRRWQCAYRQFSFGELYEPFVWARKTGCSTIPQKEHLPVQWYIVFLKPQS